MAGNIRRSSKNSWTVSFGDRGGKNSIYEIFYNFKDAKKFYDDNQDWVGKTRGRPWTPKVKGLSEELLNTATKKLTNNKFKTYSALEGKEHSSLRQLIRMEARRRKAGAAEGRGMNPKPIGRIKGVSTELLDEATKIRTKGKIKKYSGLRGRPLDQVSAVEMAKRLKEGKGGKGSGVYKRTNTILDRSKTILNRHKNPLNIRQLQEKLTGKLPTKDEEMLSGVKQAFSKLEEDPDYKNKVRPLTEEESLKTFRETFAKKKTPFLNTVRDVFVADADASLDDVAEAMVGTKEYNKVKGTAKEVQYLKDAGYQVNEFLKAISNPDSQAAKMSGFKDIPIYKLGPIIQSIADRVNEFGFERETIRELMTNVADASRKLPLGATENAMRKLRKAGLHIDEIVGKAATFENAPGYMEAIQQIRGSKNILKRRQIDNYFSKVFNESLRGEFKNVDEYNTFARQFSKKQKIDTPLIKIGKNLNPEEFVSNFKDFSPGAQENIKEIAKEKGIVIQTKGKSLFKESGDLAGLLNRLVADGAAGGGSCDLAIVKAARSGNAPGGVIGPDCSGQIKQVIQENPDQLIKEAAEAKVKPGESTGFRNVARQILNKIPKGGRLGAILAGAGAVGGGAYALLAGDEAQADTMKYNATTGQFDDAEGEPETQEGILNWIADNPIKSGLAPIPALLGASHFAPKAAARALTSFPALVAPALAAEKLYQYKQGVEPGDMALDPLNALWALGWDSPKTGMGPAGAKGAYYAGLSDSQKLGLRKLATKQGWKDLPKAMKAGIMSPRAAGTKMVFPFAGPKAGAGIGSTLLRGTLRLAPFGPIPLALSAGYYGWNKYKDIRDTNSILDSMREQGNITEEDADTLRTIMKQGWLGTTSLGAKILGSEELELGGEMIGLDQQKQVLDNLLADVNAFQEGDPEQGLEGRKGVRAKERQQEFFNWFSDGGRVGMKAGGMDRRTFLKWLAGIAATATGLIKGKGLTTKAPVAKAVPKAIAKFQGVEGMPLWFPRAVAKIKAHGKLLSMADKHYVEGDMYEMMIPVTRKYLQRSKPGEGEAYISKTEYEKVIMEENPLTGEISMQWTGTDNFGDDAVRQINFKPGEAGYQKFGVDPEHPGAWEYQRVKVEEPEFTYSQPDQSQPYRDDVEYLDISTQGDEIVEGLEKMTGGVTKEGTVVDDAFQKKIYRDIEGEDALLPDPEGHMTPDGWQGEGTPEIIEGDVPDWVPKDEWPKKASGGRVGFKHGGSWADWMSNHSDDMTFEEYLQMDMDKPIHPINKNTGGIIETGKIARRPGAVPPLSGPSPDGIMSLYSNPKQVNVG